MTYSHAFDLGFELVSQTADGSDVTQDMFVAALMRRIASLIENNELCEAVGLPSGTYEKEPYNYSSPQLKSLDQAGLLPKDSWKLK